MVIDRSPQRRHLGIHVEAAGIGPFQLGQQPPRLLVLDDRIVHEAFAVGDRRAQNRVELPFFGVHVHGELSSDLQHDPRFPGRSGAISIEQAFEFAVVALQ